MLSIHKLPSMLRFKQMQRCTKVITNEIKQFQAKSGEKENSFKSISSNLTFFTGGK